MNKPTKEQKRKAKKRRAENYAKLAKERSEARKLAAKKRYKRQMDRMSYAQPGRKFARDEMNERDTVFRALLGIK